MKRLFPFLFFALFASAQLHAQKVDDSLRYAESIWSMEKKAMVLEELDLTEAEKAAFWPVYESYSNAIQYLDMEYIRLQVYPVEQGLSGKKSAELTEQLLMNELLLAKTRRQYFRKFRKALTAAQASKFMDIDNDFRMMIRLQMRREAPALLSSIERMHLRN